MDFFEDLFKKRRPQKLRTQFKDSNRSLFTPKHKRILIGVFVAVVVSSIVSIALVLLLIRWLWNAGTTTTTPNPTVSSVIESAKESTQSLLPTVPSVPQDFIQNGAVNEAKIKETFTALPEATKQVWKNTMQISIAEQLKTATGEVQQQLEQLSSLVQAL